MNPIWNNSTLSRNLAIDVDRQLNLVQPKELMKNLKIRSGKAGDMNASIMNRSIQGPTSVMNKSMATRLPTSEAEISELKKPMRLYLKPKSRSNSVDEKNSVLTKTGSTRNTGRSRDNKAKRGKPR